MLAIVAVVFQVERETPPAACQTSSAGRATRRRTSGRRLAPDARDVRGIDPACGRQGEPMSEVRTMMGPGASALTDHARSRPNSSRVRMIRAIDRPLSGAAPSSPAGVS